MDWSDIDTSTSRSITGYGDIRSRLVLSNAEVDTCTTWFVRDTAKRLIIGERIAIIAPRSTTRPFLPFSSPETPGSHTEKHRCPVKSTTPIHVLLCHRHHSRPKGEGYGQQTHYVDWNMPASKPSRSEVKVVGLVDAGVEHEGNWRDVGS